MTYTRKPASAPGAGQFTGRLRTADQLTLPTPVDPEAEFAGIVDDAVQTIDWSEATTPAAARELAAAAVRAAYTDFAMLERHDARDRVLACICDDDVPAARRDDCPVHGDNHARYLARQAAEAADPDWKPEAPIDMWSMEWLAIAERLEAEEN